MLGVSQSVTEAADFYVRKNGSTAQEGKTNMLLHTAKIRVGSYR